LKDFDLTSKFILNWKHKKPLHISLILGLVFITLFFRNSAAVYPGLLDEFYYNQYTRLLPFSEARYGNFLYYFIYRITNSCGNGFLSCVYFLNVGFYVFAFIPIYAIAKRYCNSFQALWIALLAILSPFNYWTVHFMPESLYFLLFWVLIWALLCMGGGSTKANSLFIGVLLGLCMLIKIHAFFLAPAIVIFITYRAFQSGSGWLRMALANSSLFVIAVIGTKYLIGFVLAGQNGLTLFGAYGGMTSHASDAVSQIQYQALATSDERYTPLAILLRDGPNAFWVNILPLCLLYAPAIAMMVFGIIQLFTQPFKKSLPVAGDLWVLSGLVLSSLIMIVGLFQLTLIVKGMGQVELFWRYYEFSFPLLLLCAVSTVKDIESKNFQFTPMKLSLALLLAGLVVWDLSRDFGTHWIAPQIDALFFYSIGVGSIAITLIWVWKSHLAYKGFIWLMMPAIIIGSNIALYHHLQASRIKPNDSNVGMFINSRLSKGQLEKLVVVQDNNLTQTVPMMYFNQAPIEFISIPESQKQYDLANLPLGKDWVLLMGNHELVGEALHKTHEDLLYFGGMTLFGGHGNITIDFKNAQWKGVINKHSGLFNPPEPWGAWSIDEKIKLDFVKPLPRKFNLILNARAFGSNLNNDFILRIGSQTIAFRVNSYPEFEQIIIPVENLSRVNSLEIDIPKPISPKEIGLGEDSRNLGIGLTQLQIQW